MDRQTEWKSRQTAAEAGADGACPPWRLCTEPLTTSTRVALHGRAGNLSRSVSNSQSSATSLIEGYVGSRYHRYELAREVLPTATPWFEIWSPLSRPNSPPPAPE